MSGWTWKDWTLLLLELFIVVCVARLEQLLAARWLP